jgi:hypothetical protein
MSDYWKYQFLEDENVHYVTQWHPERGIIGEEYFQPHEYGDLIKFCIDNNLSFEEINLPLISQTFDEADLFAGKYRVNDINFNCTVNLYDELESQKVFKSQFKFTLEMLEDLAPQSLGEILKQLLEQFKEHVKNES